MDPLEALPELLLGSLQLPAGERQVREDGPPRQVVVQGVEELGVLLEQFWASTIGHELGERVVDVGDVVVVAVVTYSNWIILLV